MQVKKFHTGYYDANSYLVNGKVLIDTGINTNSLISEIEKIIDIKNIELIILTHCHYDHTASAEIISKKSGADIAIHKADIKLLHHDEGSAAAAFGSKAPSFEPDILLEGGENISISDEEHLEIIHTPGHTPGCICLYEPLSKSLFSGDTIFPQGSIGRTDFIGGSAAQISNSIKKITQLDIKIMYPGHGEPTSDNVNRQIELSYHMAKNIFNII
ncbi:MAG: MBL fold metallo-hydrolase [Methanomethylovorans sp.]|jgi:glyoxylase-like metal-dependent hydrolase (beta-lactamase superfamily II)|nr:MBL fold metallo-hydrolase [Methanomethylovorans sp.]